MKYKKYIFGINSYYQAVQTIKYCQNKKIFPIIFIKYFILKRLGLEWVKEFKNLLDNKFSKNTFDLYIDCKKNYGLFLHLVDQKIKYLKIENNQKNDSVYEWLNWNNESLEGTFVGPPVRDQIPEKIKEQLIVELYSK